MSKFLGGIAVRFYRGIGPEVQFIGPFSSLNFFIGTNNAGKSIVLNLLNSRLADELKNEPSAGLEPIEVYKGQETGQFTLAVGMLVETFQEHAASHYREKNPHGAGQQRRYETAIDEIAKQLETSGQMWTRRASSGEGSFYPEVDTLAAQTWTDDWSIVWHGLHPSMSGGSKEFWVRESFKVLANLARPALPAIHLIPAKRELGAKGEAFNDLSGRGLIDHLADLQDPDYDKQADRGRFDRINAFLREVTGKPHAKLNVPSNREHLLVHMDNKVLPLSALGTGIHEVVLIAAFCTIHDGSIMCIEEPEIHLHPLLQKKLINYLAQNTESQYFIATHSSSFIDTAGASVFHVRNDGSQTFVKPVLTKSEKRNILDDLGCQASDILQANAVIWVEGPSDRIYLKHWIQAVDDSLIEGVHYTLMFYGGALISHLSASDEALEDFIKLRDLNRHMAIVIDSDKSKPQTRLKPHAQRLKDEMSAGPGIVWITAGREVENYVDGDMVQSALKVIHPKLYKAPGSTGRYDNSFHFLRDDPAAKGQQVPYTAADKVGLASLLCGNPADLTILDLGKRANELVQMIRSANNLA